MSLPRIIDSTVGQISEQLSRLGLPGNEPVRVIIGPQESLEDIAARMRRTARQRGMTDELFDRMMADE